MSRHLRRWVSVRGETRSYTADLGATLRASLGSISRYRFGVFEFDTATPQLRKAGRLVRLRPQGLKLLTLLVSRPREVVGREEIAKWLWDADVFVDVEQGVNHTIKQVRAALGDDAESPRYVETIPRRGYRFIAPVEVVVEPKDVPVPAGSADIRFVAAVKRREIDSPRSSDEPVLDTRASEEPQPAALNGVAVHPAVPAASWAVAGARTRTLWLLTAALVIVALVAGTYLTILRPGTLPPREDPQPIATPLTAYPGAEDKPSLSPDGSQVAFTWDGPRQDNFDIYVKLVGPGEPMRLTTAPDRDDSPAWSPDGRHIAFLRIAPKLAVGATFSIPAEVFVMPALGGAERRVAAVTVGDSGGFRELAWTPDAKWLAIGGRQSPADAAGIWLVEVDGPRHQRLTTAARGMFDVGPVFAPDGRRMVFIRGGDMGNLAPFVLTLSPALEPAGEPVRVASPRPNLWGLTWTPDGRSLLYSSGGHLAPTHLERLALSPTRPRSGGLNCCLSASVRPRWRSTRPAASSTPPSSGTPTSGSSISRGQAVLRRMRTLPRLRWTSTRPLTLPTARASSSRPHAPAPRSSGSPTPTARAPVR